MQKFEGVKDAIQGGALPMSELPLKLCLACRPQQAGSH